MYITMFFHVLLCFVILQCYFLYCYIVVLYVTILSCVLLCYFIMMHRYLETIYIYQQTPHPFRSFIYGIQQNLAPLLKIWLLLLRRPTIKTSPSWNTHKISTVFSPSYLNLTQLHPFIFQSLGFNSPLISHTLPSKIQTIV